MNKNKKNRFIFFLCLTLPLPLYGEEAKANKVKLLSKYEIRSGEIFFELKISNSGIEKSIFLSDKKLSYYIVSGGNIYYPFSVKKSNFVSLPYDQNKVASKSEGKVKRLSLKGPLTYKIRRGFPEYFIDEKGRIFTRESLSDGKIILNLNLVNKIWDGKTIEENAKLWKGLLVSEAFKIKTSIQASQ